MSGSEMKVLFRMLDQLIKHFQETNNNSLIARIYGVYTLKTNLFVPVSVMIMQNSVLLQDPKNHKLTFDLKGSSLNRYVRLPIEDSSFWRRVQNHSWVLKDNNFMEICKDLDQKLVKLDQDTNEEIFALLRKDVEFLSKYNIMDYSLLLVIEKVPETETTIPQERDNS